MTGCRASPHQLLCVDSLGHGLIIADFLLCPAVEQGGVEVVCV